MYGKWWNLEELFREIIKEKIFFNKTKGGITVSGGEPTLQPDFLLKILKLCKENGISTALDTCGYSSSFKIKFSRHREHLISNLSNSL